MARYEPLCSCFCALASRALKARAMGPLSEVRWNGISSQWFNVVNFIVFDFVLLSVVFHLTTDISGRLNDQTSRDHQHMTLYVTCPPLIGGGLSGTSPGRSNSLLVVRIAAFMLVLGSTLTIGGGSTKRKVQGDTKVLALGPVEGMAAPELMAANMRRTSCQGITNHTIYFGELRDGEHCELDRSLIRMPVQFSKHTTSSHFTVKGCTKMATFKLRRYAPLMITLQCANAVMQCITVRHITRCHGVVHIGGNLSYVCTLDHIHEGVNRNQMCQQVWNLAHENTSWVDAFQIGQSTIHDLIFTAYGASEETRRVLHWEEENYTTLSKLWFLLLAVKCITVTVLMLVSCHLRAGGFVPVFHDENGLLTLLHQSIHSDGFAASRDARTESPTVYLYSSGASSNHVEISPNPVQRRRNQRQHEAEREHY